VEGRKEGRKEGKKKDVLFFTWSWTTFSVKASFLLWSSEYESKRFT
jgi:hypothetical protein